MLPWRVPGQKVQGVFVTIAASLEPAPDAAFVAGSDVMAREAMIESQLKPCGIIDARLISALYAVAREDFVPLSRRALAYSDSAHPLGEGRELMQPLSLGYLLQAAAAEPGDRVLVIGAGTGYATAILARLAATVTALECSPALAQMARANLAGTAATLVEGPLEAGWAAAAPFSLILIDGAIETLPPSVIAQLAEGGRVAAILVGSDGVSRAALGKKHGQSVRFEPIAVAGGALLSPFRKPVVFQF